MFIASSPYVGSLIATSDDGGGPPLLMIFLAVMGLLVIASFLGGARPTVVVVQRNWSGLLPMLFVIAGGLGLLYVLMHVPSVSS